MTIPQSRVPLLQHALDTYTSEIQKLASTWRRFSDEDLSYRPHEKSVAVGDIMKHELLSARRFFGGFLGLEEPAPEDLFPQQSSVAAYTARMVELAERRLIPLSEKDEAWWLEVGPFFDVQRQRVWILWRRILHTAHHRTQLTVYLRLLGKPVPAIYGPSRDETWSTADPTYTVDAAGR